MSVLAARYLDFARCQIENSCYDEALILIEKAKERGEENPKIYELTGKISELKGDNEEAIRNYHEREIKRYG